jgi:hypothetical protein
MSHNCQTINQLMPIQLFFRQFNLFLNKKKESTVRLVKFCIYVSRMKDNGCQQELMRVSSLIVPSAETETMDGDWRTMR